jgi:membrane protease YdiL (CAAX protease family)
MVVTALRDPRQRATDRARSFAVVYLASVPVVVLLDHLWRQAERAPPWLAREPVLRYLWPHRSLWLELALGIGAGLLVVAAEALLRPRLAWLRELERMMHGLLGKPSLAQCLGLAAVSALGEEVLFRGLLQPRWGLLLASVLFGALHAVMWQYAVFALILGFLLGYLSILSGGGLLAPVLCHFTINAIGLWMLSRSCPADAPPWESDAA